MQDTCEDIGRPSEGLEKEGPFPTGRPARAQTEKSGGWSGPAKPRQKRLHQKQKGITYISHELANVGAVLRDDAEDGEGSQVHAYEIQGRA